MINIRYHIVSIAAVFLALGIGTALGSTFLDRYTVNVLDGNIRSAETRIKAADETNQRLSDQVDEAQARDKSLIQAAGQVSLSADLTDVPVLVVATAGVEQTTVDSVRTILDRSGADLRGTLQLRSAMRLDQDVDQQVVDTLITTPSSRRATRTAVHRAVRSALLGAGQPAQTGFGTPPTVPGDTTPTTVAGTPVPTPVPVTPAPDQPSTTQGAGTPLDPLGAPDGTQPTIITALIDADYLRFAPGPSHQAGEPILETTGYRFVFVSAPGLDPDDDQAMIDMLPVGPRGQVLPAVVVSNSVTTPADPAAEPVAPSAVASVRDSQRLTVLYSTVDNVETFSGLVATVVALDEAGTNAVGHYGQGKGATSLLPPAQ